MKDLPELAEKIQAGEITLNQVSLIQKASREIQKIRSMKVSSADKSELLNRISRSDFKFSQKEVAAFFDLPVVNYTKQTVQADESMRIEVTLTKELYDKLQKAQALLSHALGDNEISTFLDYMTDKIIAQKTSVGTEKSATSTWNESQRQVFTARQNKMAMNNQPCCQFRDPITQKQCSSKWYLQVDHIQAKWAGGFAVENNAQVLCAAHNKLKYRQQARIRLC